VPKDSVRVGRDNFGPISNRKTFSYSEEQWSALVELLSRGSRGTEIFGDHDLLRDLRSSLESWTSFSRRLMKAQNDGAYDYRNQSRKLEQLKKSVAKTARIWKANKVFLDNLVLYDSLDDRSPPTSRYEDTAQHLSLLGTQIERLTKIVEQRRELAAAGEDGQRVRLRSKAIDFILNAARRAWWISHGNVPLPQSEDNQPRTPFSRFCFEATSHLQRPPAWPGIRARLEALNGERPLKRGSKVTQI
jgi:hypothetical protein